MRLLRPTFALLLLVACTNKSSGGSGPEPGFDAATADVTFAEDTGTGPVDAASDGGACPHAAGAADGACNSIQNLATSFVAGTCMSGAQPMGTGGAIADGTYVLTARTLYTADGGCVAGMFESTMQVTGHCVERVDRLGQADVTRNMTFETNGTTLLRVPTCGAKLPGATYTATATDLTIFDQGGAVTVWTKQ